MSRILGIKEIAFDCQPSATCNWGLEQLQQGHRVHFCFLCVHLSFIPGPNRPASTSLSHLGNDRSSVRRPPAPRSRHSWMGFGNFHTKWLATQVRPVAYEPPRLGVKCGLGTDSPSLAVSLPLVCRGLVVCRDISGILTGPGQAFSSWLGLVPFPSLGPSC